MFLLARSQEIHMKARTTHFTFFYFVCRPCSTPGVFEFQTEPRRYRVCPWIHVCSWNEMEPPLCSCNKRAAVCNWHATSGSPPSSRPFPHPSSGMLALSISSTTSHHIWSTIVICAIHGSIITSEVVLTFESYLLQMSSLVDSWSLAASFLYLLSPHLQQQLPLFSSSSRSCLMMTQRRITS